MPESHRYSMILDGHLLQIKTVLQVSSRMNCNYIVSRFKIVCNFTNYQFEHFSAHQWFGKKLLKFRLMIYNKYI